MGNFVFYAQTCYLCLDFTRSHLIMYALYEYGRGRLFAASYWVYEQKHRTKYNAIVVINGTEAAESLCYQFHFLDCCYTRNWILGDSVQWEFCQRQAQNTKFKDWHFTCLYILSQPDLWQLQYCLFYQHVNVLFLTYLSTLILGFDKNTTSFFSATSDPSIKVISCRYF